MKPMLTAIVLLSLGCGVGKNHIVSNEELTVKHMSLQIEGVPSGDSYTEIFNGPGGLTDTTDLLRPGPSFDPTSQVPLVPHSDTDIVLSATTVPDHFEALDQAYGYELTWVWRIWKFDGTSGFTLYEDRWTKIMDTLEESGIVPQFREGKASEVQFSLPSICSPGYRIGVSIRDENGNEIGLPEAFRVGKAHGLPIKRECGFGSSKSGYNDE